MAASRRRAPLVVLAGAGTILAVAVAIAIAVLHRGGDHRPARATHEERPAAPDFSLVALDGATLSLAALRGKVVLVDFWATWCDPCRDEIPRLVELQRARAARGLQVVGISMDDSAAPVKSLYDQLHMNYPVALGDAALGERFGGVLGLPVKVLVDREGRIASKHEGAIEPQTLAREVDALLAE